MKGGRSWRGIRQHLADAGYDISEAKLSPDMFGIPQLRERAFIVGRRGDLEDYDWPGNAPPRDLSIRAVLDKLPREARYLETYMVEYLNAWQELLGALPADEPLPTWPIWATEFGADYPYVGSTPFAHGFRGLGRYRGTLGRSLAWLRPDEVKAGLPSYARERAQEFPAWKVEFIRKNRIFYRRHSEIINTLRHRIEEFPQSFQKIEWNCKGGSATSGATSSNSGRPTFGSNRLGGRRRSLQ